MIKKTRLTLIILLFAVISSVLYSCSKDEAVMAYADVEFRLMDGPCGFDNLYVDVQGIEIHSNINGWESLEPFNQGIYDILELANGLDTLLCKVLLPEGTISQVRLILGDNNTIVVDGVTHDIKVPSGSQSGLKLNLHQTLLANTSYTIWLDFDACKSVVVKGNGSYSLKPVIRAFTDSTNGKLTGYVLPDTLSPLVQVIENTDTINAIPRADGFFLICGLDGTYDVLITPNDTAFSDTLISNVTVDFGQIVDLDSIILH